ncbi:hypothetical protein [Streptomyces sp. NPDC088915]|uniref:hypothetical protein n=1 Tax=Streptomyces sp. NPDC088915 TaxID=3365912 RepID=UPI003821618B
MNTETTVYGHVDDSMDMAVDYLRDRLDCTEPTTEQWARVLDCGTVRVRIRVDIEPTGRTAEQYLADVIASDPAEAPELRAAAAVVAAGGPGLETALTVLRAALA